LATDVPRLLLLSRFTRFTTQGSFSVRSLARNGRAAQPMHDSSALPAGNVYFTDELGGKLLKARSDARLWCEGQMSEPGVGESSARLATALSPAA